MHARFALAVAAALVAASAVAAEPVKPTREGPQSDSGRPQILLASVDAGRPTEPGQDQAASTQRPRRIARVTSCRCGDPQPQPDQ